MNKDTGGPAFPADSRDVSHLAGTERDYQPQMFSGMTLLDYFAGQAMQGELASQDYTNDEGRFPGGCYYANNVENRLVLTEKAYAIAEAMIAEKRRREV